MQRHIARLLIFLLVAMTVLSGCSPSDNGNMDTGGDTDTGVEQETEAADDQGEASASEEEVTAEDLEPLIDMGFETDEQTQLDLAESDDGYMSMLASPFYMSTTFTDMTGDTAYAADRRALIEDILAASDRINELAPEVEAIMDQSRNDLLGLMDSFIAADLELPYVYAASNRYMDMVLEESLAEAQLEGITFDGYDTLADGWMAYQYTLYSLERGLRQIDRAEWIAYDGANLLYAAESHGDEDLIAVAGVFEQGLLEADQALGETLGELVEATLTVKDGLDRLKQSDEYMSLSAMKFLQGQIPAMREAVATLEPSEHVTAEEIEAMAAYIDVLEGYAVGAELLYLEDSQYELALEPGEWIRYAQAPDQAWYDHILPVAYAAESQQVMAESSAYQKKAKQVMTKGAPEVKKKVGWLGSVWNGVKKVTKGAQQTVGAVLDTASAATKSVMDVGMGVWYGVDAKDTLATIKENGNQVVENFMKGESGATVLTDSKSMIEAVEGLPGEISKAVIGDNFVSSAIDNTSKFITGIGTSFAKGVFDLANAKTTTAQKANAAFDVAASFVSFSKVAKAIGKPFVKLGAAATKGAGKLLKPVAELAKKGITTLAKKGGALLKKAPKIFSAAQKTSIKSGLKSLGSKLWSGAKDLGTKLGKAIKDKASKVANSVKTMTKNALGRVEKTWLGKKIVSGATTVSNAIKDVAPKYMDKIGRSPDEFFTNYVENEGWNTAKEFNLLTETLYDSLVERKNRDDSRALMEAKKSDKLPSITEAKEAEKEASQGTGDDSTGSEDQQGMDQSGTSDQEQASTEEQETTGADDQSGTGEEESGAGEEASGTEEEASGTGEEDADEGASETDGAGEEEANMDDAAGAYAGVYAGVANQIVFYDTEEGEMSFPLGAEHSQCQMEVMENGYVVSHLAIFGTGMFDFDVTIMSSFPATLEGSKMTYYFIDGEGDKTTVTGTISDSSYSGTIGLYSGKNERIGHITFTVTR